MADEDESDQLEQLSSIIAVEDDLEFILQELEPLLEGRMQQPRLYFQNRSFMADRLDNITVRLNQHIDTAISNLGASVEEISESIADIEYVEAGSGAECDSANQDDVFHLLESGLSALARRQDLREALKGALEELDPEAAENLILDADLPTDQQLPQIRSPEQVSVLKLLNSPILGKLTSFVDFCLDSIGGYIDPLDQFLDVQAEKYVDTYDADASSLGRVAVVYLLVQSGHLNIPLPAALREYLESKRQGRALLEAFA